MRALIRFLTRGPGGTQELRERTFEGESLTIGRATDQVLHLKDARVALAHARIVRSGSRTLLSCKAPAQVLVNDALVRDSELTIEDRVQIGANILRVVTPPAGFDLALTFELDTAADARAALREPPRLALAELGLKRRPMAWALFVGILALGLIVPWLATQRAAGNQALRAAHLPSDRAWSSGPLHLAHSSLERKCESCHEHSFLRVRNSACLSCHATHLHQHLAATHPQVVSLMAAGCTDCHREHEEPARLIQTDQRLCATCHGKPGSVAGASAVAQSVSDFADQHPEFQVSMLERSATADWQVVRHLLAPALQEQSNLRFPHAVHLSTNGVRSPDGTAVMQCADCHQSDAGGARMQPISMEKHCARCHRLDFDPAEPERTVPHGDPARVESSLLEYFSARYLAGYPDQFAIARPDRPIVLPNQQLSPSERARLLGLARERAQTAARDLFERRVCVDCHVVSRQVRGQSTSWNVLPVRLTQEWLPNARFDHSKHGTSVTPCVTCHAAGASKVATDVLLPGIRVCRDCHAGQRADSAKLALVPTTCTDCHVFHAPTSPLWQQTATVRK